MQDIKIEYLSENDDEKEEVDDSNEIDAKKEKKPKNNYYGIKKRKKIEFNDDDDYDNGELEELNFLKKKLKYLQLQNQILEKEKQLNFINNKLMISLDSSNLNNIIIKSYYNNKFHTNKWSLSDYESNLNFLSPPLDWYNVGSSVTQFLSYSHGSGTINYLKMFYPYCDFSLEDTLRDNNGYVLSTKLTKVNNITGLTSYYIDALGKKIKPNADIGYIKGSQTYSSKYSSDFNVLKTYSFPRGQLNEGLLTNLNNVMQEFKANFPIQNNIYKFRFRHALDAIAHFYLDSGVLPPPSSFNVKILKELFPPSELMNDKELFYTPNELESDPDLVNFQDISIPNFENELKIDDINANNQNNKEKKELGRAIIPRDFYTIYNVISRRVSDYVINGKLPKGLIYRINKNNQEVPVYIDSEYNNDNENSPAPVKNQDLNNNKSNIKIKISTSSNVKKDNSKNINSLN